MSTLQIALVGRRRLRAPALWLSGAWLFTLAFAIRGWSFGVSDIDWDEGLYLVIAQRWRLGELPYVAVWDLHPIGLPAILAALGSLHSDLLFAARTLGTLCIAATGSLLAVFGARFLRSLASGTIAGTLYVVSLSGLYGLSLNTELINNLLIGIGAALLLEVTVRRRGAAADAACIGAAGLIFGAALQVKYQVFPEVAAISALFLWSSLKRGAGISSTLKRTMLLVAAGLTPTALTVAYFAAHDALTAFIDANVRATVAYVREPLEPADVLRGAKGGLKALLAPMLGSLLFVAVWRRGAGRGSAADLALLWVLVWLAAAALDVLAPLKFWPHYFFALAAPLSLLAGLGVVRLGEEGRGGLITAGAILAALLALVGAVNMRDHMRLRANRTPDVPTLIAARVRAGADEGVYVFDYNPVIYYLAAAKPPTRFVLPVELDRFSAAAGVDGPAELRRILAGRPRFIVRQAVPGQTLSARANAELERGLAGYIPVAVFNSADGADERSIVLYEVAGSSVP